jgi:cupin fold WbuC family metalloprotein
MVILQHRGRYYRPHKHAVKCETVHLIEGALRVFIFKESGEIARVVELTPDGGLICRIGAQFCHLVTPASPVAVYHESKNGPFLGDQEFEFPAWAPDEKDRDTVAAFLRRLDSKEGS